MIIDGTNGLTFNNSTTQASAGVVLQVVSTTITAGFTASGASMTDITGLSATITPKFSTSKILIILNMNAAGTNGAAGVAFQLVRGSTNIAIGDANGSRQRVTGGMAYIADPNAYTSIGVNYLDSPATTSATTYKVQGVGTAASASFYINRSQNYGNTADYYNATSISTITLMEIAA